MKYIKAEDFGSAAYSYFKWVILAFALTALIKLDLVTVNTELPEWAVGLIDISFALPLFELVISVFFFILLWSVEKSRKIRYQKIAAWLAPSIEDVFKTFVQAGGLFFAVAMVSHMNVELQTPNAKWRDLYCTGLILTVEALAFLWAFRWGFNKRYGSTFGSN